MSAAIPDGWTRWRRSWPLAEVGDQLGSVIAGRAKALAEGEGLEVDGAAGASKIEIADGQVTVVLTVRPADGSAPAEFRE